MDQGSKRLARSISLHLGCYTFAVAYLLATLGGVGGPAALGRSVLAAAAAVVLGRILAAPVARAVLDVLARRRAEERSKEQAG